MLRCLYLLAAITLLFLVAEVSASSKPSDAELAAITGRGVFLAEYDAAAWRATDAVKAAHPVEARVGRYIARKTEGGWVVDFGRLNEAGDKFLVAYEAVQRGNSAKFDVKAFDPAREDAGWNLAAEKLIGVSKLTRIVRLYSKRFTSQERLCHDIANELNKDVRPRGVAVYIRAEHFCMQARGVRELSSQTGTLVMRGDYNKNPLLSEEFRLMIDRHAVPSTLAA